MNSLLSPSGLVGRLRGLYNLLPLGGSTGGIRVQQKGGVPGTDEGQIYHDGNDLWITNGDSAGTKYIRLVPAGVGSGQAGRITDGTASTWELRETTESVQVYNGGTFSWSSSTSASGSVDTAVGRAAAGVIRSNSGWVQSPAGRAFKSANQTVADATLVNDTHLTFTLKASRKYSFLANLFVTTGAVLEGIQIGLAGGATVTNLIADVEIKSHAATPVFTMGRLTALSSGVVGQTVADVGNATVTIAGTFEVNAAGTFLLQWAKNASTGATTTTVNRGSWMWCEDTP